MFWLIIFWVGAPINERPAEFQNPTGCAMEAEQVERAMRTGRTGVLYAPAFGIDVVCVWREDVPTS
ncbi:MAG: hypothetical protein AAFX07_00635 [Pseudomonadota bacterium]